MIELGIVGTSPGNGHPYSFSAIINGYDPERFSDAGWPAIARYLDRRGPSEFGVPGLKVSWAWTQDEATTERLCRACDIPGRARSLEDLADRVDAVLIARDDHRTHHEMAMPFLGRGIPTFVDKPLSLDPEALREMREHLESGLLMSCSGMRFAGELDVLREAPIDVDELRLIRALVPRDWERYGIHGLEAAAGLGRLRPLGVTALPADHDAMAIALEGGALFELDAMGELDVPFRLELIGTGHVSEHVLTDNFTMFRRLLFRFRDMIGGAGPPVPPSEVIDLMRILIAGCRSRAARDTVFLADVKI